MRIVVLLAALASACTPASPTAADAAPKPHDARPIDGPPPDAYLGPCAPNVPNVGSGNHNPGQDCQGVCHDHGFNASGTLFDAPGSWTPFVGATITITDATGKLSYPVSTQNGNFYTYDQLTYPIRIVASSCPQIVGMQQMVMTKTGCNSSGACHGGSQGHIHLP